MRHWANMDGAFSLIHFYHLILKTLASSQAIPLQKGLW